MSIAKNQKNTKKYEKKGARVMFYMLDLFFAENHTIKNNKCFLSTGKRKNFTALQRTLCAGGQEIQYVTKHLSDIKKEYVFRKGKRRPLHIRIGNPFHIKIYLRSTPIGKILAKNNPNWLQNPKHYRTLRWLLKNKFTGCESDTKLLVLAIFYYKLQHFKINPIDEILCEFFPNLKGQEQTRMRKKIIFIWNRIGYKAGITKNGIYAKLTPRYLKKRLKKSRTGDLFFVCTAEYKKRQRSLKNLSYFLNNNKKCRKINAPPDENYENIIISSKKSIFRSIVWSFLNSKTEKRRNRKGGYYLYNPFCIFKDNGKKIIRKKFANDYCKILKSITLLSDPRKLANNLWL